MKNLVETTGICRAKAKATLGGGVKWKPCALDQWLCVKNGNLIMVEHLAE